MKLFICSVIITLGIAGSAIAQTPTVSDFLTAHPAAGQSLPPYVLYRHFLRWVNSIGGPDAKANVSNIRALRNALPTRIQLADNDLQFLRSEAFSLMADLEIRGKKAALIVAEYRKQASVALQQGRALPPGPAELVQLQQERTALLVEHYVRMRTSLGSEAELQLDQYLKNEFAPHVSISDVVKHKPTNNLLERTRNQSLDPGHFE
jgi:hypothetical protein